jgi:hypothetical protein
MFWVTNNILSLLSDYCLHKTWGMHMGQSVMPCGMIDGNHHSVYPEDGRSTLNGAIIHKAIVSAHNCVRSEHLTVALLLG